MDVSGISIALVLIFITVIILREIFFKSGRSDPPGPTGIPIFGNLLQIKRLAYLTFTEWTLKYGPIYSFRLGAYRAFVLGDMKLIREAYNETSFCGRPDNEAFTLFAGGKYGVLLADGPHWNEQRRFTLRHLKDFAFGKRGMESLIMEEVRELISNFKKTEGTPISPNRKFSLAILNALWTIVTGVRYKQDDPKLTSILEDLFKSIDKVFGNGALMFIPQLRNYFPSWSGWNKTVASVEDSKNVFQKLVQEHKETLVPGSPRDFIDSYLEKIAETKDLNSSFYGDSGYKNLYAVIADLFMAGAETTANTLTWAILYLATFPNVQKRLQEEIDQIVGNRRLPTLDDKPQMPYAEAILLEVLRFSPTVVMGMFHYCTSSTKFHGYDIPEGSYICSNFHWVHRDPEVWGDPENFRPERFLSEDGSSIIKYDEFLGFSCGKRICLGEVLARDEFFLFLTGLFQRFDVKLEGEASLDPAPSFMNVAKKFKVVMTDRME